MKFQLNDGGRAIAGFLGQAGDCVVRSIAIVTAKPYAEVYRELGAALTDYARSHRHRIAKRVQQKGVSVRNGVDGISTRHTFVLSATSGRQL